MNSSQPLSPRAEAAQELLARRQARGRLYSFIQYLKPDYILSDFARTVCDALDEFLIDMADGKRPILCIGAPPQHGKSEIVSRFLPAYAFGRNPDMRIGGLSYAFPLATNMNRDVQRIMLSPEYERIFPGSALNKKRVVTVEVEAKRNSEEFEIVGHRGSYIGQGVGGPLTGKSLDLGIVDDPIKNAKEAASHTVKEGIWNWYTSTFMTRLSKSSGQIIMATRWATDDLTGRILARGGRAQWLSFKAINDQGEALIPELHPIDKLLETRDTLGAYQWEALYQQSPTPREGGMFKPHNIQIIDALPAGLRFVRGWDLAASRLAGDWTAGVKMATQDGITYIANVARIRGGADEVEALIGSTAQLDGVDTKQSLPQDPGQAGKAQASYLSRQLQGVSFEFSTESGDKAVRADPFSAQVNAGNVRMVRAPWNQDIVEELQQFPHGAHDDMVDACSRAFNALLMTKRGFFG